MVSCTKNVDIVFHFAGMADIDQANKFPADSLNLNVNGTINVLEACVKNKVKNEHRESHELYCVNSIRQSEFENHQSDGRCNSGRRKGRW